MVVPAFVEELHEAHAALDEPAGEQAVHGEAWLARLGAVQLERLGRFLRHVHEFGRAGLHAVGHLEGIDARGDLGIADRREMPLIKVLHEVERLPLHRLGDACGIGQVEDWVAGFAERHALVNRRQKAAAVERRAAAQTARRVEHDKARKVLRFAAQPVQRPRAEARPAELARTRLHQDLAGSVIERVGGHRLDDRDVVSHFRQVRKGFGNLSAGLAVSAELELAGEEGGVRLDEGVLLPFDDFRGHRLAVEFLELRLVVEQVELRRRAAHEEVNDVVGLGRVVGRIGREGAAHLRRRRRGRGGARTGQQRAERHRAEPDAALLKEPAACDVFRRFGAEFLLAVHAVT